MKTFINRIRYIIPFFLILMSACRPAIEPERTSDKVIPTPLSTQTYVSHQFHVALEVPGNWEIVRALRSNNLLMIDSEAFIVEEVYQGDKDLLIISALSNASPVDETCEIVARQSDDRFGSEPKIKMISTQEQSGCIILPSDDQPEEYSGESAAIISYPEPTVLGLHFETFNHVVVIGLEPYIETLAQSIRFEISPEEYLTSALDIIQDVGISFNEDLDWDEVREEAFNLSEDAERTSDTYAAINHALRALQTEHTFFLTPEQASSGHNSVIDGTLAVSGKRLESEIGYLNLQDISGNIGVLQDYAHALHQIIQEIDQEPTCGWIISLRGNTGGSVFPMITGLTPIIGEGEIGGFQLSNGDRKILSLQDGYVMIDGTIIPKYGELLDEPLYKLKNPMPPVAVLVDQQTASAAEITALAFVGRPNSRLFGEPTGGYTTGNEVFPLFDGAMMILSFAKELDQTGKAYSESINPDKIISSSEALEAATDWILTQPPCRAD